MSFILAVALFLLPLAAVAREQPLFGDWQQYEADGSRVLLRFQPEGFGIRHHFSSSGTLRYSVTFSYVIESGEFDQVAGYLVDRINSAQRRKLALSQCGSAACVVVKGLGVSFSRVQPNPE